MKVIAMVAHTIDGFIARESDEFVDWSSKEDKQSFATATKAAGVIIMGMNTHRTISKPLPGRLNIVMTSHASTMESIPGVLEFRNEGPHKLVKDLTHRGLETVFVIGGASVYSQFLADKLIDELWVTIEPVIFGQGIANFNQKFYGVTGSLLSVDKLNDDTIQLKYQIKYD